MQFRPLLASKCTDIEKVKYPVLVSPKLDGIRCVIRHGCPLTRTLKPIPNAHVREALRGLPSFDGELVVGEPTAPDVWHTTQSAIMSHEGEPDFKFYVFDWSEHPDQPFAQRLDFVKRRAPMYGLNPVLHHKAADAVDLAEFESMFVKQGYEGLMIRDPLGVYKFGRSTEKEGILLKMKRFDDMEAILVDAVERKTFVGVTTIDERGLSKRDHKQDNYEPAGDLGAFVCDYNGVRFEVGTGFTAEQRIELWEHYGAKSVRGPWGRYVKIKHQGFTKDGKPRFPVFMGFRDERDMS